MKNLISSLILIVAFNGAALRAEDQSPVYISEDLTAGFVRYIYIVMDDQVDGGCWTNIDGVKATLRLALEREGIGVLREAPAFYSPSVVAMTFRGLGLRSDNSVCASDFTVSLGRYSGSSWGGDYGTTKFNFYAWHEFWTASSVFLSGRNHDAQAVGFAEETMIKFLGDYFAAKRTDEVAQFYTNFPKLLDQPLTQDELEKMLVKDVE